MQGLYRDSGKENGNYYNGTFNGLHRKSVVGCLAWKDPCYENLFPERDARKECFCLANGLKFHSLEARPAASFFVRLGGPSVQSYTACKDYELFEQHFGFVPT